MFRRKFITGLTVAGVSGLAAEGTETKTVTYRIQGFSCVTCAVGLDTMLQRQDGVVRSKSSYPDATTTIEFRPSATDEKSLKGFILEMGFIAK